MVLLTRKLAERGHRVSLVTIFPGGHYEEMAKKSEGVFLESLYSRRNPNLLTRIAQFFWAPLRLRRKIKKQNPDRLYSMLEFSNLFAWLATIGELRKKLVWGIRSSSMNAGWKMKSADKLCVLLSLNVPLMISNSYQGLRHASERGYQAQMNVVIPNGINTCCFRPDHEAGLRFRDDFGFDESSPLIGIVGRISPKKGCEIFLEAAANVIATVPECQFVCVGDGPERYKKNLIGKSQELGLSNNILWAGNRKDMVAIYNALDALVSSSLYGEGFSNVIGEAMACGTPCVVTDVGDSAWIVGDSGVVCSPGDAEGIALGIKNLLSNKPISAKETRGRIEGNFSIDTFVERTIEELKKVQKETL